MTRAVRSRLDKLEATYGNLGPTFTREEFEIGKYELLLAIGRTQRNRDLKFRAEALAAGIADEIRATAKRQRNGVFLAHLNDYVLDMWRGRMSSAAFLLPVIGSEYDDWEKPGLYKRRIAVRHRPSVIALLGAPDPTLGSFDGFPNLWRNLHVEVLRHICSSSANRTGMA